MKNGLIGFTILITGACNVPESQFKFDYIVYFTVEISEFTMTKLRNRQRIAKIVVDFLDSVLLILIRHGMATHMWINELGHHWVITLNNADNSQFLQRNIIMTS